jgi:hypothetical protein
MVILDAQTLWVPGPLPGMNEILKLAGGAGGTKAHYARVKRDMTALVRNLAVRGRLRPVARAALSFRWQEAARRRDPDNVVAGRKFIMDGLVAAGVLPGDGWDHVAAFTDEWVVAARHGVLVTITPAV